MKKLKLPLLCLIILASLLSAFPVVPAAMNGEDKITVVLDPGHGGTLPGYPNDPGATYGGITEREQALKLAFFMKDYLEETGKFEVFLTRDINDSTERLDLCDRALIARQYNPDILVSLHFNSIGAQYNYMRGATVLASVKDRYYSEKLANLFLDNLNSYVGLKKIKILRRTDELSGAGSKLYYWNSEINWDIPSDTSFGQLADYYGMIGWCTRYGFPAYILEHAYISNEEDRKLIADDEKIRLMAKADADALITYYTDHEHVYTDEKVVDMPSNCIFEGTESYHCTVCGCRKEITPTSDGPAADHHLYYLAGSVAPTCTKPGSKTYYCGYTRRFFDISHPEFGNHIHVEEIPATGHKYEVVETVPTTGDAIGYTRYRCTVCGDEMTLDDPDACRHEYHETGRIEPTCTESGSVSYHCNKCGNDKTETVPALGHDMKTEVSPAGVSYEICKRCGFTEYDLENETMPVTEPATEPESETVPVTDPQDTIPETVPPSTDPAADADTRKQTVIVVLIATVILCALLMFLLLIKSHRK